METINIKDLHNKLIELLTVFHSFCELHDLKYVALGGTCLGVVRHKGFIPWDDDADVAMPRDDYNLFVDLAKKEGALPAGFTLQCFGKNEPHYNDNWVRIRMDNTKLIIPYHQSLGWNHLGIFLDVFPYEPCSTKNVDKIYKKKKKYDFYARCFSNKVAPSFPSFKSKLLHTLLFFVSKKHLYNKRENFYRKIFDKNIECFVDLNTKYGLKRGIYPSSIFEKRVLAKFENIFIYIPSEYDVFLKIQFGDYHKLPPIEERVGHLPNVCL